MLGYRISLGKAKPSKGICTRTAPAKALSNLETYKDYLVLRDHVKDYRDDGDVDQPHFGYEEEDAVKIMELLKEKGSSFAPLVELTLGCGLRFSELAGLKGKDVDKEHGLLHVVDMVRHYL